MKIRFRYSLKWFLLGTTLIAVLAGTVGKRLFDMWQSRQELAAQEKARLRLMELGVQIHPLNGSGVVSVQFPAQKFTSRDFELLRRLPSFENIDLASTGFADADLPALANCRELKMLSIDGNAGITDKSVKSLAQLTELEFLGLSKTGVTDESFKYIAGLQKLKGLHLVSTNISSKGLAGLGSHPTLQNLDLSYTLVDDEVFPAIAQLPRLERLRLEHTRVHGHGISALARMPHLKAVDLHYCELQDGSGFEELHQVESLYLDGVKIPPGFLRHVAKMRGLRTLRLLDSEITREHLAELAEAKQIARIAYRKTPANE